MLLLPVFFFSAASGFQTGIKRKREEEDDGDLNIDGDDSEEYGKPQYPVKQPFHFAIITACININSIFEMAFFIHNYSNNLCTILPWVPMIAALHSLVVVSIDHKKGNNTLWHQAQNNSPPPQKKK